MNRRIKFKLFNTKTKEMVNYMNCMITLEGDVQSFDKEYLIEGTDNNKHLVPLQYTGLKDKYGEEIYEGDIVTSHNGSIQGVVLYQAPEFIIKRKLTHKTWTQFILNAAENQYQEIIGNIYENPKLLELK